MDRRFDAARLVADLEHVELYDIASTRGRNLNNVPRFRSALRAIRPERLVTYNFGSIEWAFANAWTGIPHLHVEDGFGPEETERRLLRRSLLRSLALRLSGSSLVTVSQTLTEVAHREWYLPNKRIALIPNGIRADSFRMLSQRGHCSTFAPANETVIGTVAGLRVEKRIDRLLEAFARLPKTLPAILVIVGSGPLREQLETLAQTLGIEARTRFLGQMDHVEELYAEFDIFALSSDTEQLPLVLLEAMAAGLPVASTDVGDIRNVLSEPNRRWLCGRDAGLLSASLRELITAPKLRKEVGIENARIVRQHYTDTRMYNAWEAVLSGQPTGSTP